MELEEILAKCDTRGYVIAPAGFGKTHLIASSVRISTDRQLILTHTYAGVNSLRKKLMDEGVESSKFSVETIASWSLKLCLAYPKTSGWSKQLPSSKEWNDVYLGCQRVLNNKFSKRIILSTYGGLYVDEYQDCSNHQHSLIFLLSNTLPCRILGDPLQAIFDFSDIPVSWDDDVYPNFQKLGELNTPWRWKKAGSHELGEWLVETRTLLERNESIKIPTPLPNGLKYVSIDINDFQISPLIKFKEFYKLAYNKESVITVFSGDQQSKNQTHSLSRALGGRFTSIEEVEGKALNSCLSKIEKSKTPQLKLKNCLDLLKKCFSGVDKTLTAGTKRGEPSKITKSTKHPEIARLANAYLDDLTPRSLESLALRIRDSKETKCYRRDLFNRFMRTLKICITSGDNGLTDAYEQYNKDFRNQGRPLVFNKQIGTTLLVKGLEYDHCIVINPNDMPPKAAYVAISRGAKSLCILQK